MKELDYTYIANLVIRSQCKDSDAFAEIYALTYNKVYNYARYYLRDAYLAQDAVQDIYISALKNINNLKDPSVFIAWLNQISFHVCYDICKKNNEQYGDSTEILELIHDEHIDSNPEAHAVSKNESQLLKDAIDSLPLAEQQVITLRYYNNLKINEIADAIGSSKSTVKRYLANAQAALQQKLKQ